MYNENALMSLYENKSKLSSTARGEWGVPFFDEKYNGLPQHSFNLLETEDRVSGLIGIARFIITGIRKEEVVTLVTFDSPENTINKFLKLGYDFEDDIKYERLFILSYKSTFSRSLNISTDYYGLFAEIKDLSNGWSSRLAFLNADLLFNLESYNLTLVSLSKVCEAAKDTKGTILAQFLTEDNPKHKHLRDLAASLLNCYLVIRRSKDNQITLEVKVCH